MTDYHKYINALRKCAEEHENDRTSTGHIIVSDLCRDTANLLEELEQEPTTKNDLGVDCISRADVLKLMQDNWHTHNGDWAMQESMDDIRALPSVTPQEPKTGHWIEKAEDYYKAINEYGGGVDENTDYFTDDIACPKCLSKFSTIDNETERFKHCPNCGAKMNNQIKTTTDAEISNSLIGFCEKVIKEYENDRKPT